MNNIWWSLSSSCAIYFFSKVATFHISYMERFYAKILKCFKRALKVLVTLVTFLDFAYFSSYLQIKETVWKRGDAIFSEPEWIWSFLDEFWKILIRSHNLKFDDLITDTKIKGTLMQIWKSLYMLRSYKNNTLKISHSESQEFSSYLPVKFVNFLKSRLIFNIFYCFWMFINKLFTYLTCA